LWRFAIIAVIYDDLHKPGMEVPMFTENRVLMENSWNTLNFRWSQPALASLLYLVIQVGASAIPIAGWFGSLVIAGPLMLGYVAFMVAFFDRAPDANIEKIFTGFNNFANAFVLQLVMTIFIFLWSLLLIIPGIMATYSYSMAFFIMHDDPQVTGTEAIRRSKEMMNGHRWRLFCLDCRFIGWWLLCILSLGIGSLWIMPYHYGARLLFYRDLTNQNLADRPIPENAPEMIAGFYGTSNQNDTL